MPILFLAVVLWGAWVALTSIDPETWLRLVAAVALVWHPWHEQRLGFRYAFNAAIKGMSRAAFVSPATADVGPGLRGNLFRWRERPLSRRMNAVQALALATAFPALALWGPWWALAGLVAFYGLDQYWTHAHKEVPGFWSANAGLWVAFAAFWFAVPEKVHWSGVTLALGSLVIGAFLLVLPWWMAHRTVRRQS